MTLPTERQWARYSALCARLRPLPPAARAAALQALRAQDLEDPQVLSLVAVHFALPPTPDRLRTGERVGACTLEEPLGAGGMGVVYRAQQHLGPARRAVAVKLIQPALWETAREEALSQFLTELHTLAALQHDGIARIYDGGLYEDPHTHAQLPYLVMELVRGGLPLTTYARDYALPWPERLAVLLRVCRALEHAHEHRVVHRDLKPANILVDPEGRPVVIDFGLACAYDALLPGAHLVAAGTPAYMSPEQVSDAFGPLSTKSDVYALGLLFYELLTGELPYTLPLGGTVAQWHRVITETVPPPLSRYDTAYGGELEAVAAMALAKAPAARPTVAALRSRLERLLQPRSYDSARPGRPTPPLALETAHGGASPSPGLASPLDAAGFGSPDAERRQVTVLFCDLVGSTALAGQLDPEDYRDVLRAYLETCTEVITRFGGNTDKFLGDGALVCFGYPQAQEDDPQRAVRTGLGIVEAVGRLNTRLEQTWGIRVAVRLGVHTGLVVAGALDVAGARDVQAIMGETPNIAARLQELAAPDTVVCSAATARLVEGYFALEALGPHVLKGVARPMPLYRVVGAHPARTRFDVAVARGLTPLVGREPEVALLRERWAAAQEGRGQVVFLSGEAGIGKSRLVQEVTAHLPGEAYTRMAFHCSPYHQHSALSPVLDWLQQRLHLRPDGTAAEHLHALEAALQATDVVLEEAVPLLAAFLGLPVPARYPPLTLSPERQKQKTLELLLAWLLQEVARQPVLMVWEDLHWADPSSLEWLGLLLAQVPTARLLLLLLFRPEFQPPWPLRSYGTPLALGRLSTDQTATMIRQVGGGHRLPAEVIRHVAATTDGVPLFIEELTKTVVEAGLLREREGSSTLAGPLPPLAIPATLYDTLMARLDRLGPAKQVAQLGAVLGREFPYAVLQAVALVDEATLQPALGRLVEAELLYQRGLPPHATYLFKHALIQEAAYQSLLRSTRQHYHQHIAQVLEERFPETATTEPEVLARHYAAANQKRKALDYAHKAGSTALQRSANAEAIQHITEALQWLDGIEDTQERARVELTFNGVLTPALMASQGYGAPALEATTRRSLALIDTLGDDLHVFPTLWALTAYHHVRSHRREARTLAQRSVDMAERTGDTSQLVAVLPTLAQCVWLEGHFKEAKALLERAVGLYDPIAHRDHAVRYGMDSLAYSQMTSSQVLWAMGFPDQAREHAYGALTHAKAVQHANTIALALLYVMRLHTHQREREQVLEVGNEMQAHCERYGLVFTQSLARLVSAWARRDVHAARQMLAANQAMELLIGMTSYRALVAEAEAACGHYDAALALLEECLQDAERTGERCHLAHIYRLQGGILLAQDRTAKGAAEGCFRQAIAVAQAQHAPMLELLATTALCHLWRQEGNIRPAREMLTQIYDQFTEGFATPPLVAARALLEEIGRDGLP